MAVKVWGTLVSVVSMAVVPSPKSQWRLVMVPVVPAREVSVKVALTGA